MAVITITKENFEKEVMQSEKTVLLDFWASWCGPCRMLSPVIDSIAQERDDVVVGKINVDEEAELARDFGIESIPTVVAIRGGRNIGTSVGYKEKADLLAAVGLDS